MRLLLPLLLLIVAAAYPGVVGWQMASALMHPTPFDVPDSPEHYGLTPEAIMFTARGQTLNGWLFEPPGARGRAVLFLHGWRSHKRHMLHDYMSWLSKRYAVLAFDHPNHGDGPPGVTTLGAGEREDAAAALALLRERGYDRIGVFGSSMGGTTAIGLAARDAGVRAVVSDATFARPEDVPVGYLSRRGYLFPELVAGATVQMLGWRAGRDLGSASAIANIPKLASRPVFLIHGDADHVIAPDNADRLFAAASEPKTLWKVPGADHVSEEHQGPYDVGPAEYERRVTAFFDRHL